MALPDRCGRIPGFRNTRRLRRFGGSLVFRIESPLVQAIGRPDLLLCARECPVRPAIAGLEPEPIHILLMPATTDHIAEDLWVFGYGSLMWRPGFAYLERIEARLIGAHRALCIYSFVHRGTPERPGLVLGLDHGGTCRWIAYRVAAAERTSTVAYLRAREQATSVYRECTRAIWLRGDPERRVPALCYVVDRGHAQYAGRLTLEQQLHLVRQGHGQSGANRDYVVATVAALEQLGYRETALHLLAERLGGVHPATSAVTTSEQATRH
jgi:cation transport protein ChaC